MRNKFHISLDIETNENSDYLEHQIRKYFDGKNIKITERKLTDSRRNRK